MTRRPDDKVASRLSAIASDMASRNDNYDPALAEDGAFGRRLRLAVILIATIIIVFTIAGIVLLLLE
ncbi:MAG TPA: hypothetical protein VIU61_09180 [Kofleriaceae bacterium]